MTPSRHSTGHDEPSPTSRSRHTVQISGIRFFTGLARVGVLAMDDPSSRRWEPRRSHSCPVPHPPRLRRPHAPAGTIYGLRLFARSRCRNPSRHDQASQADAGPRGWSSLLAQSLPQAILSGACSISSTSLPPGSLPPAVIEARAACGCQWLGRYGSRS
jgi:hypothetical protein